MKLGQFSESLRMKKVKVKAVEPEDPWEENLGNLSAQKEIIKWNFPSFLFYTYKHTSMCFPYVLE